MMAIGYETRYYGPTDNRGSRIKVTNMRTGDSKWHYWDYSVDGGKDQHEHALLMCADVNPNAVEYIGETKTSYLWVA